MPAQTAMAVTSNGPVHYSGADETARLVPYEPGRTNYARNPDLEELLQQTYSKRLEFPSEHHEVKFIQKAIETILVRIAKELDKYKRTLFETGDKSDKTSSDNKPLCNIKDLTEESGENLCKLGSFYERTKNTFPDEFDFVYVPYRLEKRDTFESPFFELKDDAFRRRISYLSNAGSLIYRNPDIGEVFFEKYEGQSDIAAQFQFAFIRSVQYYRKGKHLKRTIRVNLIPGILIVDRNLKDNIETMCPIPGFRQHILDTSSSQYLLLPNKVTAFCESEVRFMNHVLSKKHVAVYRLLKYIVNGNRTGEELEEECKRTKHPIMCSIPSYAIKTAMIRHHYQCTDDSENLGACALTVLHMFEQSFLYPVSRFGENSDKLYVQIGTPTNRPLTLAYGDEDFIQASQKCISRLTNYLRRYRKTNALDIFSDTFSMKMVTTIRQYDHTHGSKIRQYRNDMFGNFGLDTLGKYCYTLSLFLVVVGFCSLFLYLLVRKT